MRSTKYSLTDDNLQKHKVVAKNITEAVATRFPFGGINILENIALRFETEDQLEVMVKKIETFHGKRIPDFSKEFLDVQAGYCDDLADCAVQFAAKSEKDCLVEFVGLQHHAMLIVGRDQNSDPNNIDTWVNSAFLFDVWAKKSIKADEFKRLKNAGKFENIPFVKDFSGADYSNLHYLDGEPSIDIYRTCRNYSIAKGAVPQSLVDSYIQQIQKCYKSSDGRPLPDVDYCLRIAASRGDLSKVCFLVEYAGADSKKSSTNGRTALDWARVNKHSSCEDYLNQQQQLLEQSIKDNDALFLARSNALFFAFPNVDRVKHCEQIESVSFKINGKNVGSI